MENASRYVVCDVPGQPWVVDISYMDTAEGWSYLAVILIQPPPFLVLVLALSVDLRIMSVIILSVIVLTVFFFTKSVLT